MLTKAGFICIHFYLIQNAIYLYDCKAEFSAAIAPVSHNTSEIILICRFAAQKYFLLLMLKEEVVLANIYFLNLCRVKIFTSFK